jgi:hypothetical protein
VKSRHDAPPSDAPEPVESEGILVIRRGPGANCSSIGSAVEMLFLSAAVGAAVLAAVVAALKPRAEEATPAEPPASPSPPGDTGPTP